ncbi:hypothetical protein RM190_16265 [Paracoccus sp. CPCC 101403]|uniref:Restriction endonuclease n=1 Tax=Paracoccus broussonetiae TaxID=3075834 RepID=A0ABU3EGR8_9RHOB|nr:hypothetical protein [Paracoccus sp. CPCC 101403]MDT1063429.1 hypothetical protein [Paracoccus sp. CPCC 101403]
MSIRPRTHLLRLPYTNEAFPPGVLANGSSELTVTWDEILWAALTIGRPSVHHVFAHGAASFHEAMFRLSVVRMALEQYGPTATRLRRTSGYKSLDPTEKGAISYFLGMTFCKVFSSRLLSTPWLLHLDIFKSTIPTSVLGQSRPDLLGQQIGSGDWLSFETKGRASKPSSADCAKAKAQAMRLISVNGKRCTLHVGSFAFFANDALHFHWIDPPSDPKRPIEIPEIGDAWRFYYGPSKSLWDNFGREAGVQDQAGLKFEVPFFDITIRVHPLLAPFFVDANWAGAQRTMLEFAEQLKTEGFQQDGLKIASGPSWRVRADRLPVG